MTDDFPAAHSMDTTWFAIDRDGHVAAFDTGEAGALPRELGRDNDDQLEAVAALPLVGAVVDAHGYRAQLARDTGAHVLAGDEPQRRVLMFVRELAPIEELVASQSLRTRPTTTGHCVIVPGSDLATRTRLHELGVCVGCQLVWSFPRERVAVHGLYDYEHSNLCENWIAGPYVRLEVPSTPVTEDQLPAMLRYGAIRYSGRFADTIVLQPAEHWQCTAHSQLWLASDHKTRRDFDTGEIVTDDADD